jgi:type IV conjugative transfer system lipoprotein TraV
MMKSIFVLLVIAVTAGCAVEGNYSCKAPNGVGCKSIHEVYGMSVSGALSETKSIDVEDEEEWSEARQINLSDNRGSLHAYPIKIEPNQALRSDPVKIRILVFPWVDKSGDFHDQSYIYTVVEPGRWMLRENLQYLDQGLDADYMGGAFKEN